MLILSRKIGEQIGYPNPLALRPFAAGQYITPLQASRSRGRRSSRPPCVAQDDVNDDDIEHGNN